MTNLFEIFDRKEEYCSCENIRNGFNFYRSNKVSSCCYSLDEELNILKTDEYKGDLKKAAKKIIEFQNNLIKLHKSGNAPETCKKCVHFKKALWKNHVNKKFGWISLNHYKVCNLKCTHCGYTKGDDTEKDSDHELVLKLINRFSEMNRLSKNLILAIGGGEPSINKGIEKILQYCIDKNYHALINSNGAKFSPLIAKGVNMGLFTLDLTPDAGSKEVYAKIKGVDCFDLTWKNIKEYMDNTEQKANVKFIIEAGNSDDVGNMIDTCVKNNVKNVKLSFDLGIEKKDFELYRKPVNDFINLCKSNNFNLEINSFVPTEIIDK